MARTTPLAVQGLLDPGGDYNGHTPLAPFIATAHLLVNRVEASAAAKGLSPGADELELLERWLGAHFYCMSDQTYAEKSTERARGKFHGQTGKRLEATKYGQTALDLDSSGALASLTANIRVGVTWLGREAAEQTPYDQRN